MSNIITTPGAVIGYRKDGRSIRLIAGGSAPTILDELRDQNAEDFDDKKTPEILRGKTPDELQAFVEILDAHLRSIHQTDEGELRDKTAAEQKAFDYGLKVRDKAIAMIEENRAIQEVFRRRPKAVETAYMNISMGKSPDDPYGDVRRLTSPEARDRALRVLDDREATMHLSDAAKTQVAKLVRQDSATARRIIVTENDDYRNAWMKLVLEPHPILTPEENRAVQAWNEFRVMADFTTTAGGFGIPVKLAA